jgi:thioredoxin-related protein
MISILRKCLALAFFLSVMGYSAFADQSLAPLFTQGNLSELQSQALKTNQAYFIYFYAKDSRACKKMNRLTWADEQIGRLVEENFLSLGIDALSTDIDLIQKYSVFDYPTILFFKADGTLIGKTQGYMAPEALKNVFERHISSLGKRPNPALLASRGRNPAEEMEKRATETQLGPTITVKSGLMRPMDADPITVIGSQNDQKGNSVPTNYQTSRQNQTERGVNRQKAVQTQEKTTRPDNSQLIYQLNDFGFNGQEEIPAPVATRGGEALQIHLSVTGFEDFSLRKLATQDNEVALGLLVKQSTSFSEMNQEVERFQRFWQGDLWIFAQEKAGVLFYNLVLGTYPDQEKADIFSKMILEKTGVENTIVDLKILTR